MNYVAPKNKELCSPNEDVKASRKGCDSDEQCIENVRYQCDMDPGCFGISWLKGKENQDLKLCRSKDMVANQDGWRTWIKQEGNHSISF